MYGDPKLVRAGGVVDVRGSGSSCTASGTISLELAYASELKPRSMKGDRCQTWVLPHLWQVGYIGVEGRLVC